MHPQQKVCKSQEISGMGCLKIFLEKCKKLQGRTAPPMHFRVNRKKTFWRSHRFRKKERSIRRYLPGRYVSGEEKGMWQKFFVFYHLILEKSRVGPDIRIRSRQLSRRMFRWIRILVQRAEHECMRHLIKSRVVTNRMFYSRK